MKRIITLSTILALLVIGLAVPALAATGSALASPTSGPAGTRINMSLSGFTFGAEFEIHGGSLSGPVLATGRFDGSGAASAGVTIPTGSAAGEYQLHVCETTYVACTDTTSDFWVGAIATFRVEAALPPAIVIPSPIPPVVPPVTLPTIVVSAPVEASIELSRYSGYPGARIDVLVSGFTPDARVEAHTGGFDGSLRGSRMTDGSGSASIEIMIPMDAEPGALTIAVCEASFVDCTDTESDFWVGSTATFTVEELVVAPLGGTAAPVATTPTTVAEAADEPADEADVTTTLPEAEAAATADTETEEAPDNAELLVVEPTNRGSTNASGVGSGLWWALLTMLAAACLGALAAWRQGTR